MKAIQGYHLIKPEDLHWRPSNLMKIPNADYLERTGSENLGARLWRLPPKSANTLHKHIRSEEFYFVLEGTGRMRVGDETLTVPKYGGVLVGPDQLRQVFNDTDDEVLWLIIGAPEELEFLQGSKSQMDLSLIYPVDPKQLPKELAGVEWPPKELIAAPRNKRQEIRRWKLRELIRSRRGKVRRSGSQVQFESNPCLKVRNRHVRVARASRSSPVHAPHGIRIRSVRR